MVGTYLLYLAISAALTIWVGRTIHTNGLPFLLHAFENNAILTQSINNLLLAGFYLVNFGFVALVLRTSSPITNVQGAIELLSVKIGEVLLVLGGMHFFNMHMLHKLGRRVRKPELPPPIGRPAFRGAA